MEAFRLLKELSSPQRDPEWQSRETVRFERLDDVAINAFGIQLLRGCFYFLSCLSEIDSFFRAAGLAIRFNYGIVSGLLGALPPAGL